MNVPIFSVWMFITDAKDLRWTLVASSKKVFWHRHKYDHIHRIPLYWSASSFFLFFVGYFLLYMWGFLRSVSALSYFKIQQTEKNCISNVLIKNTLAHQISVKSLTSPRKINTRLTSFVGLKHLHFVSTIYSHWARDVFKLSLISFRLIDSK